MIRSEARSRIREAVNEILFDAPTSAPTLATAGGGSLSAGVYKYAVVFTYNDGRSALGPKASITLSSGSRQVTVSAIDVGTATSSVIGRQLWRTKVDGNTYFLASDILENDSTSVTDSSSDTTLGKQFKTFTGFVKDDQINFWVNFYNQDVAGRTNYLKIDEDIPNVSASNLTTTGLILSFNEHFRANWSGGNVGRLKPVDMKDLDAIDQGWETRAAIGEPRFVYRKTKVGNKLHLWPQPSTTGTVSVTYPSVPNDLTSDSSVLLGDYSNSASDLNAFAKVVIYGSVGELKRTQGKEQEANNWFQLYQQGLNDLKVHTGDTGDESQIPFTTNYPTVGARPELESEGVPSAQVEAQKAVIEPPKRRRRR